MSSTVALNEGQRHDVLRQDVLSQSRRHLALHSQKLRLIAALGQNIFSRPNPPPLSEWTIESTKLSNFRPPGLAIDYRGNQAVAIENPYVTNPIPQDEMVDETDRSWHGYKPEENKYFLPNDEAELCRLDRQHVIWIKALQGAFHLAPVQHPQNVLDLGTGSGIWAMQYAQCHPGSEIIGVDISESAPDDVPSNCRFERRDFTDPWEYQVKFDLIHARLIFAAQQNVPDLLRRAYDTLAPGGYLEHQELYGVPLDVGDGSLRGTLLEQFFFDTVCAAKKLGINMLDVPRYADWMREAGFEDVTVVQRALPINTWAQGAYYKGLGAIQNKNLEAGLGGLYTRMLIKGLGWSVEKTAEAVAAARDQLNDDSIHAYFPLFVIYGRKPMEPSQM